MAIFYSIVNDSADDTMRIQCTVGTAPRRLFVFMFTMANQHMLHGQINQLVSLGILAQVSAEDRYEHRYYQNKMCVTDSA